MRIVSNIILYYIITDEQGLFKCGCFFIGGWLVGNGGTIWTSLESANIRYPDRGVPSLDRLYSLYFIEDSGTLYGWMAGALSTGYAIILRSTNSDATSWTESFYSTRYTPSELLKLIEISAK